MVRAGEQKAPDDDIRTRFPSPGSLRRSRRRVTGGKLTGQKPALNMKEVWSIRARLELKRRVRDLALFNLAIDSKL